MIGVFGWLSPELLVATGRALLFPLVRSFRHPRSHPFPPLEGQERMVGWACVDLS